MHSTSIVTSFITDGGRLLLLRRSMRVKTMKGLWAGISGIIEGDEAPLERARTEIFEEVGIGAEQVTLLREAARIRVDSPQYKNHEWEIYPFLFEASRPRIRLNWENTDYRWIAREDMSGFETVPNLERVLSSLL